MPLTLPRRVTFVAKAEYFNTPGIKGWFQKKFFSGAGQVPIDRSGATAAEGALKAAKRILDEGDLFGIYPEGTRSHDGKLYRGKTGVARLALECKVPVIPVAVVGTDVVAPPGQTFGKFTRPIVRFGKPLDFSRYEGMENDRYILRSITDEIMYEIMRLSGQEYVDMYASRAKEESKKAADAAELLELRARRAEEGVVVTCAFRRPSGGPRRGGSARPGPSRTGCSRGWRCCGWCCSRTRWRSTSTATTTSCTRVGGVVCLSLMAVVDVHRDLGVRRPARAGARCCWSLDLAAAVGAVLVSPVLKGEGLSATVPAFWVMGALLAWAIHWRWLGGLLAGVCITASDLSIREHVTQANYGNAFLLLIGGPIVGFMVESLQRMAAERDRAQRDAAAAAERARLARAVHDGVLQVLGLVQRRGAELGGRRRRAGPAGRGSRRSRCGR